MKYLIIFSFVIVGLHYTRANSMAAVPTTVVPTVSSKATSKAPTVTSKGTTISTTTLAPEEQCARGNTSCDECVKVGSVQCLWCATNSKCLLKKHVIPTSECPLADAKWAVCWVNYEALIIAVSVVGVLLITVVSVCCCCCCCSCCKDNKAKLLKEDAKYERKRSDMKEKHADRRAERKEKTDEIRRKYGLIKEDNPYTKFEDA